MDSAADVVCLQEVTRTAGVSGWTTFRDAERYLPQRSNLFDDGSPLLKHHLASYVASDAAPVSLPDGAVIRQEFGLGIFIEPTATIVANGLPSCMGSTLSMKKGDRWSPACRPGRACHIQTEAPSRCSAPARPA